ncbi:hypothetical protein OESDEN_16228 [Oesophagostomum dentatum]|uniref:Kelch repeat protein n=1 Tax=Oesophagostomum dentatum TaxID=61180 RepID=A0A0B1SKN2_OESDE|nr:hypothetical protein OESDEN_16228 [Oesophagostomum dentatum]
MFVFDGAIHALLYTSFGEVSLKSLHKWTGSSFESVNLTGFSPIPASDSKSRVTMVVAEGLDDKTKYLISTVDHQMRVARLTSSGGGATAEHLFDIKSDEQLLSVRTSYILGHFGPHLLQNHHVPGFKLAQATSAAAVDGRLLVCFGVHGCGFRWEKGRVIACDIENKSCQCLEITSEPSPHWGFSGAHGYGLTPSGSWIHAAGMVPRGMSGGSFEGSIWELNDLKSTPTWKKLENEIPSDMEGEVVIDAKNGVVYSIGKTQIGKASL